MTTKGYWIALLDVTDPERYRAYGEATRSIVAGHGGHFVVRGGRSETIAGAARSRIVVIEFPDGDAVRAWYASPEYQAILPLRTEHTRSLAAVNFHIFRYKWHFLGGVLFVVLSTLLTIFPAQLVRSIESEPEATTYQFVVKVEPT